MVGIRVVRVRVDDAASATTDTTNGHKLGRVTMAAISIYVDVNGHSADEAGTASGVDTYCPYSPLWTYHAHE